MKKSKFLRTAILFVLYLCSCNSREDEYFPELPPETRRRKIRLAV
jgi:hypothetical protein